MFKKIIKNKIFIFFIYFLLAIGLTWPLMINLNRAYPTAYGSDAGFFIWDIWHFKHVIFDLRQNPFGHLNTVLYPTGFNGAATGYNTLINKIFSLFLWPLFKNPLVIYNLLIIFNLTFASWASFLLVFYLVKNKKFAFLGGIIFGFSPYMLARSLGHLDILSTGWILLFIIYFLKLWENKKIKNALLAAFFFFCTVLSAWYYAIFAFLFILLFLIYQFLTSHPSLVNFIFAKSFLVFVLLSIFSSGLFALPFVKAIVSGEAPSPPQTHFKIYSAFILNYILPLPLSLIGRWTPKDVYIFFTENYLESTVFLGFLEIIILLYFLKNYHRQKLYEVDLWLFTGFIFFIFSLGPYLKPLEIALPYSLFYQLPIFSFIRASARYSLMVILSLTVICSYVLKKLSPIIKSNKKRNFVFIVLLFMLFLERIVYPYPLRKIDISPFYQNLRQEKGDFAVLNIPFNPRPNRDEFNFLQTIHQKNIVMGFVPNPASWNPRVFRFINQHPFLKSQFCQSTPELQNLPQLEKTFQDLAQIKIKYIIIHKDALRECSSVKKWLSDYFSEVSPYFEDETIKVYKTF